MHVFQLDFHVVSLQLHAFQIKLRVIYFDLDVNEFRLREIWSELHDTGFDAGFTFFKYFGNIFAEGIQQKAE